ncbi:hypothetical protein A3C87_02155 [Candidatus Kaiserbacteria bacterium RIFCSPHIGHO2_02_FULL_49_34]|uniref:UDP-N-acetylmuramoyl-L-alanyl-D-glutamate--2, 6-diaminopimelate ligase n=1 Tax=Candidatus Kaiserbacteria bacterium RIFCSPHIGHO2_02_FULL_49_34 TaxID=1798491 RepID=A0A1F6DM29_9BACT|nr:MAG: hypothetical protein A3C87_02155 [Candidatus Kaiserbacteria bacterium RIFCSPHIGHO2_02_FULL_49_34]
METLFYYLKKIIPKSIFRFFQPAYHYMLAVLGATIYRMPSKELIVIGVTGTKGKSSVTEIINAIFEADGRRTAVLSTIRFKIGDHSERNLRKMTIPGRFFVHKFLRDAADAGCEIAVLEMTSEGAKQFRHKFIDLDALVFTNLSPEHIESHGSYEKYVAAKLKLAHALMRSPKRPRVMVANADDAEGAKFLSMKVEKRIPYSLSDVERYHLNNDSVSIIAGGTTIRAPLVGLFNVYNMLAAIALTTAYGVSQKTIIHALEHLAPIRGRVEKIHSPEGAKKNITAVVDYAHTPDSLEKLYQAFPKEYKVCVLGNTGGGRDIWKRPEMGRIAEKYCDEIILTNEDPYDESPAKILKEMRAGMSKDAPVQTVLDRREAIHTALKNAPADAVVLISGKGTDPFIMGPNNTKIPWDDATVVREEFTKIV